MKPSQRSFVVWIECHKRQGPVDLQLLLSLFSFGFGSTGFGKVCLTPNKSIQTVYHFCSIGSVNTGTLLSSTILAACNCCIMPQELQGQFCQQASSLLNAFVLFGPLCQPGTCAAWKVSFPPSNESLMSMLLAVNCMKLSGFRSVRTTVPFIYFKNRLYLAPVRGPTWGFACCSCIWPALCNRSTNSVERVAWRSLDEGYYLGRCVSASTWLHH